MQQLQTQRKIRLPPLSEIRKYWPGRVIPPIEEEPFKPKEIRRTRKQWLHAICSDDWPLVKPQLEIRGNQDSPLIRMLIHDLGYRRMYTEYLLAQHQEPTSLLLQELKRQGYRPVADEIMESVVIDSTDL
jgi:hypothetical protein